MIPEAPLDDAGNGLQPAGDGWFVLNARAAAWRHVDGRPAVCDFEGTPEFAQVGFNVSVLQPGEIMAKYHWEADQENFLVLAGHAVLVIEDVERSLGPWDFVHCPAETKHSISGAGDGPCVVISVGARDRSTGPDWGGYTVNETAGRHGMSVATDTNDPRQAYAELPARQPTRYRDGWLP